MCTLTNCSKVCYGSKIILGGYSAPVDDDDVEGAYMEVGICEVLCPKVAAVVSPTMDDEDNGVGRVDCGKVDGFREV